MKNKNVLTRSTRYTWVRFINIETHAYIAWFGHACSSPHNFARSSLGIHIQAWHLVAYKHSMNHTYHTCILIRKRKIPSKNDKYHTFGLTIYYEVDKPKNEKKH